MDQHQPTLNHGNREATEAAAIGPQDTKVGSDASAEGDGSTKPKPKLKAQSTLLPFLPPPVIGGAWICEQQSRRDAREAQARSGNLTAPAMASGQPIHDCAISVGSRSDSAPEAAAAAGGNDDNDVDILSFVDIRGSGPPKVAAETPPARPKPRDAETMTLPSIRAPTLYSRPPNPPSP